MLLSITRLLDQVYIYSSQLSFWMPYKEMALRQSCIKKRFSIKELPMLQLAIACLVIALVAAVLGFGGIAGSFVGIAQIVFVIFLVLAVLSFIFGRRSGGLRI